MELNHGDDEYTYELRRGKSYKQNIRQDINNQRCNQETENSRCKETYKTMPDIISLFKIKKSIEYKVISNSACNTDGVSRKVIAMPDGDTGQE